ncbi:hypothetical protein TNCV_3921491 [Trichonephila clavipes]|nr:hypothetical protein TNCV_3921491 [Trichonephila clavipes]
MTWWETVELTFLFRKLNEMGEKDIYKVSGHHRFGTKRHLVDIIEKEKNVKSCTCFFTIYFTVAGKKQHGKEEKTGYSNIPLFKFKLLTVSLNAHLDQRLNATLSTLEHRA